MMKFFVLFWIILLSPITYGTNTSKIYLETLKEIQELTYIPYFPIHPYEESCLIQDICLGQSIVYKQLFLSAKVMPELALPNNLEEALQILEAIFKASPQNKANLPGIKDFIELRKIRPYNQAWSILTKKIQASISPLTFTAPKNPFESNKKTLTEIQRLVKQNDYPIILIAMKLNPLFYYYHPLVVMSIERALGGGKLLKVKDPKAPEKIFDLEIDLKGKISAYSWWLPPITDQVSTKYYEKILAESRLELINMEGSPIFDSADMAKSIFLNQVQQNNLKNQCLKDYLCNLAFSYLQLLLQKNAMFTQTENVFLNFQNSQNELRKAIMNISYEIKGLFSLQEILSNPNFLISLIELSYEIKSQVFNQYDDTFYTEYFRPEKSYDQGVRFKLGDKAAQYNLRELSQMKVGNSKMLGLHYIKSSTEPLHLSYPVLSVKNWNLGDKRWQLKVLDKDFSTKTIIVNDDGTVREADLSLFSGEQNKSALSEIFLSSIKTYYYKP